MKKNILIVVVAVFLVAGFVKAQDVINFYNYPEPKTETTKELANSAELTESDFLQGTGGDIINTVSIATTSLEAIASTTEVIYYSADSEIIDINIDFSPTANDSVLTWKNYFSHDGTTYYAEDAYTVASTTEVTHGPSVVVHKWTPGTTERSYKNVNLANDTNAKFAKTVFGLETATGTLAVDIVLRNEVQ